MSIYELLKDNEILVGRMVKNGILDCYVIRNVEIFESFSELTKSDTKENAYLILAGQYELSKSRIEQICITMSKRVK